MAMDVQPGEEKDRLPQDFGRERGRDFSSPTLEAGKFAGTEFAAAEFGGEAFRIRDDAAEDLTAQPAQTEEARPQKSGAPVGFATIAEMSREFEISMRTLRFYEDRGLLHPHREGRTRYYSARDKLNLKMIIKGKLLGFTLMEIHAILDPPRNAKGRARAGKRIEDASEQTQPELEMRLPIPQILAQIDHLERQRKELDEAIGALRRAHDRLVRESQRASTS